MITIIQTVNTISPIVFENYYSYFMKDRFISMQYYKSRIGRCTCIGHYLNQFNISIDVTVANEITQKEENKIVLDIDLDIPKGDRFVLNNIKYDITDRAYDTNGNIVYYLEDAEALCENYEKLFEEKEIEAKKLLGQREKESLESSNLKNNTESKKNQFGGILNLEKIKSNFRRVK